MAKTEENLRSMEEFIRTVLETNFNQKVADDDLRAAAARLCEALPRQAAVAA